MLLPCSSCSRHVRATSAVCPFCGATVPPVDDAPSSDPGPASDGRPTRAALMHGGRRLGAAAVAAAALLGCVTNHYGAPYDAAPRADGGPDAGASADAQAEPDSP